MGRVAIGGIALAFIASSVWAAPPPLILPPAVVVPTLSAETPRKSVSLSRAVLKLKDGQVWATYGDLLICNLMTRDIRWSADQSEIENARFSAIFEEEAKQAGFAAGDNLFEADASRPDLQVGVIIEDMQARLCGSRASETSPLFYRGSLVMTAQWQIYDPVRREVVGRVNTVAGGEEKKSSEDGVERTVYAAFRQSARALLADPAFRRVALSSGSNAAAEPISLTQISLAAAAPAAKRSIPDASGSVVAIFAGDGHGSGFLVSGDGYLLTNQHVVGGSKYVKVRWSDGFETVGEVIRSDKRRDVALVKTDPHGRRALGLRRGAVQPGEAVFALGTPLDPKFQGTVTKGVVSSTRILDGFSYIQSDVTINGGNSGGPLLDEKGAVIGIAVSSYRRGDVPTGINLFIPIGDALDFLNLKPAA